MPHPKDGYRLADGTRVPGVTTILSMMKGDPGALMSWAWKLGKEGKDYREERDRAAGIGTITHEFIDADITSRDRTMPTADEFHVASEKFVEMLERAESAFTAYKRWKTAVKLEIIATEAQLVSEQYKFGGTSDAIAMLDGELIILDWKAANHIYPEYIAQIAAYSQLWYENKKARPASAHLLRVGKEDGDFHYHAWPSAILQKGWSAFCHSHELYELKKQLQKVC